MKSELPTFVSSQMRTTPLLTAQEEKELGRKVQAVSEASQRFLARQITLEEKESIEQEGVEARNKMICANMRLVASIAKKYRGRGLAYSDLISEGYVGLIRAVEGFDPSNKSRFSTYAAWWVAQSIKKALMKTQMVTLPDYMGALVPKWMKVKSEFISRRNYEPSIEDMAQELKVPIQKAKQIHQAVVARRAVPKGIDDEEALKLEDRIESVEEDDGLDRDLVRKLLEGKATETLNPRTMQIIRMRYGFDDEFGESMTLREIGAAVGLTRERVRQIANDALDNLRVMVEGTDLAQVG